MSMEEIYCQHEALIERGPVKDIWGTESGDYEPGAEAFPSDWSWWAHSYEIAVLRNQLRECAGLAPIDLSKHTGRNMEVEPAQKAA